MRSGSAALTASQNPSDQPRAAGVGRDSALLLAAQLSSNIGYFVAVLLLARGLGPEGRGALGFLTVTAMLVARTAKVGLSETTTVWAARTPDRRGALLTNLLLFSSAAALVLGALVATVLLVLPDARPSRLTDLHLLLFVVACSAASVCDTGFLLGCGDVRPLALRIATGGWFYAAALAVLAIGPGLDLTGALAAWAASQALLALVLHAASFRRYGRCGPDRGLLLASVRFGARAWAGTLSFHVNSRADQVLMGFLTTEAVLGYYAIAVNASELLLYLPAAVSTALLPAVARQRTPEDAEWTLRVFRCSLLVGVGSSLIAGLLGPALLPLAFGHDFVPSVAPFLLLLPGVAGFAAMTLFTSALLGLGAPGRSSVGPLTAAVVGLAFVLALVPRYEAAGAAVAASVALLCGGAVSLLLFRGHVPFRASLLVPRPSDAVSLAGLARRLRTGGP